MSGPGSPSLSEPPPQPNGLTQGAQQLRREHPLWSRARGGSSAGKGSGKGSGRGGAQTGGGRGDDDDAGVRFERISLFALELQQAATGGDGADSSLFDASDDEDDKRGTSKKRVREEDSEEDDAVEYVDADDAPGEEERLSAVESEEEEESSKRKGKRPSKRPEAGDQSGASMAEMMASAAFGGHHAGRAFDALSDSEQSSVSKTSSRRRKEAHRRAFPVKGVHCIGCSMPTRIGPVERFVNSNVGRMSETALWKMAALTWLREVQEPAQKEGVDVMPWSWRDVATHFRLHTTNSVIGRTAMIQSLTAMRVQVEQCLVRVEDGKRTLDKGSADLFLKIVAADSRERQLLAASVAGGGGGRGRSHSSAQFDNE